TAHSRTSRTARRVKCARPCGHASAGLRPAAIQGRHASARPRDLLCSTIARPPDARATPQPPILHNAATLDTVLRGRPQAFVVERAERNGKIAPGIFCLQPGRASPKGGFGG